MPREFNDDRRQSVRRTLHHEVVMQGSLALLDAELGAAEQERPLRLFGNTKNLSTTGIFFFVPSIRIDERCCHDEANQKLRVMLYLPDGSVEMEVAPLRCVRLDKQYPEKGSFIAGTIQEIDPNGRERLASFLGSPR